MRRLALLVVLGTAVGCSSPTPLSTPDPLEPIETITVAELPERVLKHYTMNYEIQQDAPEEESGYRFGPQDTVLQVFTTPEGAVFVDRAGGGYAASESCAAMRIFVERNSWTDAHGCLDGTLQP